MVNKKNKKKKSRASGKADVKSIKILEKRRKELLKNIIIHIAGPNAEELVELLYGKENVNEFLISKKLKLTINQARNILYKLGDEGLVSFIRKKDKKNGGWYTYFWTLDTGKSLFNLRKKMRKEIESFERQLASKQSKQFYYCPNCDLEMSEENALLHNFTCPECGEVFLLKDNTEHIRYIEDEIVSIRMRLKVVDEEIEIILKKEETMKIRRGKAEEKKKKIERAARRKERAKLKMKEEKTMKKKAKKTSTKKIKKKVRKVRKTGSQHRKIKKLKKKKVKKRESKKKMVKRRSLKKKRSTGKRRR